MTFAFIVRSNLEKFCFEWLIRRRVQTWTTFQQIYIRLMKSDSSRSCTRSVRTKALLLQSRWLLFSFNLCICMSIKHSLLRKQPVEVGLRSCPCHRTLTILPISACTSCSDSTPCVAFFLLLFFVLKNCSLVVLSQSCPFIFFSLILWHPASMQVASTQNHVDTVGWARDVNVRCLIEQKMNKMQRRDVQKHKD